MTIDIVWKPVPERCKNLRRKLDLNLTQASKLFGVSIGAFRFWERAERTPNGPARRLLVALDTLIPENVDEKMVSDVKHHLQVGFDLRALICILERGRYE